MDAVSEIELRRLLIELVHASRIQSLVIRTMLGAQGGLLGEEFSQKLVGHIQESDADLKAALTSLLDKKVAVDG